MDWGFINVLDTEGKAALCVDGGVQGREPCGMHPGQTLRQILLLRLQGAFVQRKTQGRHSGELRKHSDTSNGEVTEN